MHWYLAYHKQSDIRYEKQDSDMFQRLGGFGGALSVLEIRVEVVQDLFHYPKKKRGGGALVYK
jgi:hypothetical protein